MHGSWHFKERHSHLPTIECCCTVSEDEPERRCRPKCLRWTAVLKHHMPAKPSTCQPARTESVMVVIMGHSWHMDQSWHMEHSSVPTSVLMISKTKFIGAEADPLILLKLLAASRV